MKLFLLAVAFIGFISCGKAHEIKKQVSIEYVCKTSDNMLGYTLKVHKFDDEKKNHIHLQELSHPDLNVKREVEVKFKAKRKKR